PPDSGVCGHIATGDPVIRVAALRVEHVETTVAIPVEELGHRVGKRAEARVVEAGWRCEATLFEDLLRTVGPGGPSKGRSGVQNWSVLCDLPGNQHPLAVPPND